MARLILTGVVMNLVAPLCNAAPATVQMRPIQVSARVWYVEGAASAISAANQGFNSNAGFVVTDEGIVVFDALGTPPLGEKLIEAIRSVSDKPLRHVIVSHYHADHVYGLQAFARQGARIWAHESARAYLASEAPAARLQERRQSLAPWVDESAHVVPADQWVSEDTAFRLGGLTFRLYHVGPAHTPEDLALLIEEEGVLFAGDLFFAGRIPFVGDADSSAWITAIDRMTTHAPRILIGGHGGVSHQASVDLAFTRDYLVYMRRQMGAAVEDFISFEEAYARTDWSAFSALPLFHEANRRNAYNTFLLMEREALGRARN
jgi:glyoxylase-like metal-dependent hydrolase (beta-lactamase superfamily II)